MTAMVDLLDRMTREGHLYEKLPDGDVRCTACGHRCLIRPGRRGICKVRFNQGGELRVPWGYVAGLQADPIEKKPFSHFLPGSEALTFGMLGCDFHCDYCFPGNTIIIARHSPISLEEAFARSEKVTQQPNAEIAFPEGLQAMTSCGEFRPVRAIFKHPYQGDLIVIRPYYLPELSCTPSHKIYATTDPALEPQAIPARELTEQHYLVVPRKYAAVPPTPGNSPQMLDLAKLLGNYEVTYRVRWDLSEEDRAFIKEATREGQTSRQIGLALGKSSSYIRHVRSKLARGEATGVKTGTPLIEDDTLRFPNEHRPGLPLNIPLDENMAQLLGYYCAEGSVIQSKDRPNSFVLSFSFSRKEEHLVARVKELFSSCLGLKGSVVVRETSLAVAFSKASAALLFSALCNRGAKEKRVPPILFDTPLPVVRAFLDAFVEGDGHRYANGKVSITTVSSQLAYGIAWLVLTMGHLPSLYKKRFPSQEGTIQGRKVKRALSQYTVVWYESTQIRRKCLTTENDYLIPIRSLRHEKFDGSVYNLEVEEIHNYLAGLLLVSNCQNWLTSQTLRDPAADQSIGFVRKITPEQVVAAAQQAGCQAIVSSYNEPLITSEWAVDIFRLAKAAGLHCAFVSNGNTTPEVLAYLRPYLTAYKIDLKTMQDRHYRELGGVLQHVLDSIRRAHELGLWVEIVTLVVPGFNDSTEELMDAARFIASVSPNIPWHVTAFHPDYKMTDPSATPAATLLRAAEIGQEAGLHYVYAGNLPGRVKNYENTECPKCQATLVERSGYVIRGYHLTPQGTCPRCGTAIAGVWSDHPENVRLGGWGMPRRVG